MVPLLLIALSLLATMAEAQRTPATADEYIRVVQEDGVWWFQDGSGHRFFSLGVNCVGGCYGHAEETPINPLRKARIVSMLRGWGFNTVGSWSSPSLWDNLYVADLIYTDFSYHAHDVFDASFWSGWIAERLVAEVQPFLGMKNFVGYFLDNEPEWNAYQIFEFYLSLAKDRPGSQAFIAYLNTYYQGSISKLNRDWRASHASFENIPGTPPPKPYPLPMRQGLLKAWRTEVAATYYRRYAAMVRALDPDHLILGIRHRGMPDIEFFRALAPYFDVHSINDYNRYGHLRSAYAELYQATGKPLMITEFSFSGFPHPGYKSGLFVDVYTQENRGVGYRKYMLQAARMPFMVGLHWFMWMDYAKEDQAIRGFPPDENVGLVSNDETAVYEELGRWIRGTNAQIDATHRGAHWVAPPQQRPQSRPLKRFTPIVDGDVSEWPKALAIKPTRVIALLDDVKVNHTYFIAWDQRYLYLAGDISDSRLDHPAKDWAWQGDYLSVHLSPVQAFDTRTDSSAAIFIYPQGGGSDGQQPYASRQYGPQGGREVPIRVKRQLRPGGYTVEARIPATALGGFKGKAGTLWKIKLTYQNVNELYRTYWEGFVRLWHAAASVHCTD
jgi:agarase